MARYLVKAIASLTIMVGTVAYGAAALPLKGAFPQIDRGEWDLRFRDGEGSHQKICFDGGKQLIQIRHAGLTCKSVVVSTSADHITVHYTCPGNGYGMTTIRRETNRLIQLDSQGLEKGTPFSFSAEARRSRTCR